MTRTMSPKESGRRSRSHTTASATTTARTRIRCLLSHRPNPPVLRPRLHRLPLVQGAVRDRLGEKEDKFAYNLLTTCAMRMSGVFAIATSTIALRMGLLFRWPALTGFLVGLLSLFAVGPVQTDELGQAQMYLRPNLTRRMGRETVADGSGQPMH